MNAVIYARYSSDNQREESIEGQLRECKEYADQNGITVVRTYIDRALSAKTDSRPQFQQMIHDSATHTFEAVLVWKLDRFSRNRYDSAHYKRILKNNRVHVVSVTEPISNTPEGIMLESLLEGMAEYYSAELAEKVSRGHKENALKAKFNGGPVPLGYRIDSEHHYQIDPTTAPVVQEAFQRYAAGESIRSIIESLNARGIRNSRGNPFTKNSFQTLLKNRRYLGEYRYKDTVIPDAIPAIIDPDCFDAVLRRCEIHRQAPAHNKADVHYLLTTKLFCGKCGTLSMIDGKCYLSFRDGQGVPHRLELDVKLYAVFDRFELDDLSFLNEQERHLDWTELNEELLSRRSAQEPAPVEDAVYESMQTQALREGVNQLPEVQKRRLQMYFFDGLTYEEIAVREGCSYQAVQKSIAAALKKIRKFLK